MAGFIQKTRCLIALQDLSREFQRPVQCQDVQNRTVLYRSILHHFGSFDAARQAAGLPGPERKRRWSREAMTKELRRLYRQGIRITNWDLAQLGRADLIMAARAYCGGVARARLLAGIPDPERLQTDREAWDQDRVLEEISSLREIGESLAPTRVPPKLMNAACYHFGSYRAAIEAAGLDYEAIRLVREPYTREDLLREIHALAEKDPGMTLSELHAHGMAQACILEFGSLEAAARAAGFTHWPLRLLGPLLSKTTTSKTLRARIREGRPISVSVLQREDPRLLRSAMRHFGGPIEGAASEDLVVEPKARPPWTKKEIRERLQARWRAGLPLHPQALHLEESRLYNILNKRYGKNFSRPEVAREFGLPPEAMASLITRWSPERVIAELRAFASSGERVRWTQMRSILRVMSLKYFGSMAAARAAAGLPEPHQKWPPEKVIELLRSHPPGERYSQDLKDAGRRRFGTWLSALKAARILPRSRKRHQR